MEVKEIKHIKHGKYLITLENGKMHRFINSDICILNNKSIIKDVPPPLCTSVKLEQKDAPELFEMLKEARERMDAVQTFNEFVKKCSQYVEQNQNQKYSLLENTKTNNWCLYDETNDKIIYTLFGKDFIPSEKCEPPSKIFSDIKFYFKNKPHSSQ